MWRFPVSWGYRIRAPSTSFVEKSTLILLFLHFSCYLLVDVPGICNCFRLRTTSKLRHWAIGCLVDYFFPTHHIWYKIFLGKVFCGKRRLAKRKLGHSRNSKGGLGPRKHRHFGKHLGCERSKSQYPRRNFSSLRDGKRGWNRSWPLCTSKF